jgi:hypothetical protein
MANPVKAAKQMFNQFLAKADPVAASGCVLDVAESDASSELAAKGGRARAASLTPKQRKRIARRAAKARWSKS